MVLQPEAFVRSLAESALRLEQQFGLSAALTIAQAALETGWGKHQIVHQRSAEDELRRIEGGRGEYPFLPDGTPSYNLFGIKRHKSGLPFVIAWTHEVIRGQRVRIPDRFRRYQDYDESLLDRYRFLTENPRYERVLAAADPFEAAIELQRSGYATDPDYASKLHSIMRNRVLPVLEEIRRKPRQTIQGGERRADHSPDHFAGGDRPLGAHPNR